MVYQLNYVAEDTRIMGWDTRRSAISRHS